MLHPADATHAFAFEQITVDNTAGGKSLTSGTYKPTNGTPAARAVVTAETAQMRYTYDGTAVTSSVGHLLEIGDVLVISGLQNIINFRAIRTGSTSGGISVSYER